MEHHHWINYQKAYSKTDWTNFRTGGGEQKNGFKTITNI